MSDAANTRENEGPCICDGCDNNPDECNCTPERCEEENKEEYVEAVMEALRDGNYD